MSVYLKHNSNCVTPMVDVGGVSIGESGGAGGVGARTPARQEYKKARGPHQWLSVGSTRSDLHHEVLCKFFFFFVFESKPSL